jgi:hypothetical protein
MLREDQLEALVREGESTAGIHEHGIRDARYEIRVQPALDRVFATADVKPPIRILSQIAPDPGRATQEMDPSPNEAQESRDAGRSGRAASRRHRPRPFIAAGSSSTLRMMKERGRGGQV